MPDAAAHPQAELPLLIVRARQALLLNQQGLADRVGSSTRTVQRWEVGRAAPAPFHIHALADAVRALEPALAAQLDTFAPRAPAKAANSVAPSPPAPSRPPPSPPVLVDAIVCAAAEAMGVSPQAVRPALSAAFARARDVGLDVESIVAVLMPPEPAAKAKSTKRADGASPARALSRRNDRTPRSR